MLVAPPGESDRFTHFQAIRLNDAGQPVEITDHRGLKLLMEYNDSGELNAIVNQQDGKNLGFRIGRDAAGRVEKIDSSWGNESYRYSDGGDLREIVVKQGSHTATMRIEADTTDPAMQRAEVRNFDGGVLRIAYANVRSGPSVRQITIPNGLGLNYNFDSAHRIQSVDLGASQLRYSYDANGRLSELEYTARLPRWIGELVERYHQLLSEPTGDTKNTLIGQQFGPYRIRAVHRSYTALRAFEVEGPDGITILKVKKGDSNSENEARLNITLSDQLAMKGFSVTKAVPVSTDERLLIDGDCVITKETLAPGQSMDKIPLTDVQLDRYARFAMRLFHQGEIEDAIAVKEAVRTEDAMRDKLDKRNKSALHSYKIFKESPTQKVYLTDDVKRYADSFHERFLVLLNVLFRGGNLRRSGLVHDNILRNYFADGDSITTFDFGGDYVGNLGNVFSELTRSIAWRAGTTQNYEAFEQCFKQLVQQYAETTGEVLSEADVNEVVRCMIMTPYVHSSSDSKALFEELKREIGLEKADDTELLAALSKPENQARLDTKLKDYEGKYLQHLKQMQMTLRLLLQHTTDTEQATAIGEFLQVLERVLERRIRVVIEPLHFAVFAKAA
jgi:YD repeat-containing protein